MIEVNQILDLEELLELWSQFYKLEHDSDLTQETLLQLYLSCLEDGAVFAVFDNGCLCGSALVERHNQTAVLQSLPRDNGKRVGKQTIAAIKQWASMEGLKAIKVSTVKLNGSCFRYFEKSLGFRRHSITFSMELTNASKD